MKTHLVLGDWNAICDQCGRKYKASQLRKRWDGLMVCAEDYETRHPQEFVRGRKDSGHVPWTRPDKDLNADGTPRFDIGVAINCDTAGFTYIVRDVIENGSLTTILKSRVHGPVTVPGTLTVTCTLEIE